MFAHLCSDVLSGIYCTIRERQVREALRGRVADIDTETFSQKSTLLYSRLIPATMLATSTPLTPAPKSATILMYLLIIKHLRMSCKDAGQKFGMGLCMHEKYSEILCK